MSLIKQRELEESKSTDPRKLKFHEDKSRSVKHPDSKEYHAAMAARIRTNIEQENQKRNPQ